MELEEIKEGKEIAPQHTGRRDFLKRCCKVLIATASYEAICILAQASTATAGTCEGKCMDLCVSCTGCTTAPCFTVSDPPPPSPA